MDTFHQLPGLAVGPIIIMKIAADPVPEIFGLTHVNDLSFGIEVLIDPRLGR
ncbi:hypothetical protein FQZ97_1269170 [compost metagenome]